MTSQGADRALFMAIILRDSDEALRLIASGADVDYDAGWGRGALLRYASYLDQLEVMRSLLQAQASVDLQSHSVWCKPHTALTNAAYRGNVEAVELLLRAKATIGDAYTWARGNDILALLDNVQELRSEGPLEVAISRRHPQHSAAYLARRSAAADLMAAMTRKLFGVFPLVNPAMLQSAIRSAYEHRVALGLIESAVALLKKVDLVRWQQEVAMLDVARAREKEEKAKRAAKEWSRQQALAVEEHSQKLEAARQTLEPSLLNLLEHVEMADVLAPKLLAKGVHSLGGLIKLREDELRCMIEPPMSRFLLRQIYLSATEAFSSQLTPVSEVEVEISRIVAVLLAESLPIAPGGETRFIMEPRSLRLGEPADAVLGLDRYMGVDAGMIRHRMAQGVSAIVDELESYGTDVDRECLHYVLHAEAGSSELTFSNGNLKRDCDSAGNLLPSRRTLNGNGMRLQDFIEHPSSRTAKLEPAHVVALRLYTTAAFSSINTPLRDRGECEHAHPFPCTVMYIDEAVKKLRAVGANQPDALSELTLYRGLNGMRLQQDDFLRRGGTEFCPMSTTPNLAVATRYAFAHQGTCLLLRIRTQNFHERGADVAYLSAFPLESECTFPPLTYLQPASEPITFTASETHFVVIDVTPRF